jgi:hypothetical protein
VGFARSLETTLGGTRSITSITFLSCICILSLHSTLFLLRLRRLNRLQQRLLRERARATEEARGLRTVSLRRIVSACFKEEGCGASSSEEGIKR